MKFKRVIPIALCVALMGASAFSAVAEDDVANVEETVGEETPGGETAAEVEAISEGEIAEGEEAPVASDVTADAAEEAEEEEPDGVPSAGNMEFGSVSGVITEVSEADADGTISVTILVGEVSPAVFTIAADSYRVTDGELAVDAAFTGYFQSNLALTLQEPPVYTAVAYAVNLDESLSVVIAAFDDNLVGINNELALSVDEDTMIVAQDGSEYADSLGSKVLLVLYAESTKSIPPQATAFGVVVLNIEAVIPEPEPIDVSALTYVVGGVEIEAEAAYLSGEVLMVPVRAIAEALGYEIGWIGEYQKVTVGDVTMTVDVNSYAVQGSAPATLSAAPELVDGRTYVPLSFFKEILGYSNAYIFEGQIVVDNAEAME